MTENSIIVVGAGIVGICSAIALQERGYTVTLMDRLPPASETSHGNAGIICNSGIYPLASPALMREAPTLLRNKDPKFLLQYSELPWLAPWLLRFAGQCNQRSFANSSRTISPIISDTLARHQTLMKRASADGLLNPTGWLRLYRTKNTFDAACVSARGYDQAGVSYQIIQGDEIHTLEPDISRSYCGAIWLTQTHSVTNPALLSRKYFQYFQSLGGQFQQQTITAVKPVETGWRANTKEQSYDADKVLITLGAWSNTLLKPLGVKLPFVMERGYHMMFDYPQDKKLCRSIQDIEMGYVITPMQQGLRATTGCNLVAREVPPNDRQLQQLLPHIKKTFSVGRAQLETPWMGRRASTPDSLPIIGPIKKHPNLYVATAHCHLGLTLAPVTGELIADEIEGMPNPLCQSFYPNRFNRTY